MEKKQLSEKNKHNCPICKEPLESFSERYPNAICKDNYCGGCFADFYVGGNQVNCYN